MSGRRRVLITGAAGRIATGFATATASEYDFTLLDLPGRFGPEHAALGQLVEADLAEPGQLHGVFDGIDTVIHLGGERRPHAPWSSLHPANITSTYNVVASAVGAGCRRVVYASSVHTVSAYEPTAQVRESDPVRPGDLYGVTKCFGEALGAFASATEDLSFVALRIGAFQDPEVLAEPGTGWMLRDYCAPEDLYRLVQTVIEIEGLGFEIFNAISANRFGRLSMEKARMELDFEPSFDSFQLSPWFRDAIAGVSGVEDKVIESGMRDDVRAARSGASR